MFDPETVASDMERIFARAERNGADKPRSHATVLQFGEPVAATTGPARAQRRRGGLVVLACCASLALVLIGAFFVYAIESGRPSAVAPGAAAPVAARSSGPPAAARSPNPPAADGSATAYQVADAPRAYSTRAHHVSRRRIAERRAQDSSIAEPLTGEALDRALVEDAAITRRLNQEAVDGKRPTLGYAPGVVEAPPR